MTSTPDSSDPNDQGPHLKKLGVKRKTLVSGRPGFMPLADGMASGKLFHLSVPQFFLLRNGNRYYPPHGGIEQNK